MSHHGHHGHTTHNTSPEGGVQMGKILVVGAVSLAIFAISAVIAWAILKRDTARIDATTGRAAPGTMIGKDEINLVDAVHLDSDTRLQQWRLKMQKRLTTYGWVDKAKGVVHIPIDQAMDQVVTQYGAGGATERKP